MTMRGLHRFGQLLSAVARSPRRGFVRAGGQRSAAKPEFHPNTEEDLGVEAALRPNPRHASGATNIGQLSPVGSSAATWRAKA